MYDQFLKDICSKLSKLSEGCPPDTTRRKLDAVIGFVFSVFCVSPKLQGARKGRKEGQISVFYYSLPLFMSYIDHCSDWNSETANTNIGI